MNKTSHEKPMVDNTATSDHLKNLNVNIVKDREAKKSQKERILEQIYRSQKPGRQNAQGSARQALKANLRQNMKRSAPRANEGF